MVPLFELSLYCTHYLGGGGGGGGGGGIKLPRIFYPPPHNQGVGVVPFPFIVYTHYLGGGG